MSSENTIGSRLQHSIEGIRTQQAHRKLWSEEDDAEKVAAMVEGEAHELTEAIKESLLTGDVFSVASEIGDVLYVTLRLCDELGLDPAQLIDMKLKRNAMKYSDAVMSDGYDYQKATQLSKEMWKAMGGDERFSHAYLEVLSRGSE